MLLLTKKVMFSSSHRLHNPDLPDDENRKIYGYCNNPMGHGHNYELEVTVEGIPDPETGMIIDLKIMKDIIWDEAVGQLDHKHLNHDVPFLEGTITTAENIAVAIWKRLEGKFPGGKLYEIKLYETPDNVVVYRN